MVRIFYKLALRTLYITHVIFMQAKKENILDFTAYMNKEIVVKFIGGREGTTRII
jgi:hypothetical protein